jgi:hypothetical protein
MLAEKIDYLFGSTDSRGIRHSIFVQKKKVIYRVRKPNGDIISETTISSEQINGIKNRVGRDYEKSDSSKRAEG